VSGGIPIDTLRNFLIRGSVSQAAFFVRRNAYTRSLAMTSICGYLLGIGDRHLENLLLDTHTGELVPIDFGYSFGMGASHLPVPELIPFRLTRSMRGVLLPHDAHQLLKHFMSIALSSFRRQEGMEALINVLELYVNDPVLDWYVGITLHVLNNATTSHISTHLVS